MILVAGGTGRLGSLVVCRLLDGGNEVRVLTRNLSRGTELASLGAVLAHGDVRDAEALRAALADVDTVVSAVHGFAGPGRVSPRSVDRDGNANLVAAASAGGAAFVLVSVVGAATDHPLELFRMKAAAESNLKQSGLPWTIVRATAFIELYTELLRKTAGKSGRPVVFGTGENPVNFVSVTEVAEVVASSATDTTARGRILQVGGRENLTLNELAARSVGSGSGGRPRHVPRSVLRVLSASGRLTHSQLARMAAAALVMDTQPMTFDAALREAGGVPRLGE